MIFQSHRGYSKGTPEFPACTYVHVAGRDPFVKMSKTNDGGSMPRQLMSNMREEVHKI